MPVRGWRPPAFYQPTEHAYSFASASREDLASEGCDVMAKGKTGMRHPFLVRACRPSDANELTQLAVLSKAHWGYPKEWLELWHADLSITPEVIERSFGYVAEIEERIIGFWIRAAVASEAPTPGWLFVHPDHMGQGVARALWSRIRKEAAERGIGSFVIEADPNAAAFYASLGAEKIGEKESTAIPGRFFPILRLPI